MKQFKNKGRYLQTGKTRHEKEIYKQFIHSSFELDKTEEDNDDLSRTDSSSVDEEDTPKEKIKKKSWKLIIKDFISSKIAVAVAVSIIATVLLTSVSFYFSTNSKLERHSEDIIEIKNDADDLEDSVKDNENRIDSVELDLKVLDTELSKDVEFIKTLLRL